MERTLPSPGASPHRALDPNLVALQGALGLKGSEGPPGPPGPAVSVLAPKAFPVLPLRARPAGETVPLWGLGRPWQRRGPGGRDRSLS